MDGDEGLGGWSKGGQKERVYRLKEIRSFLDPLY